MPLGTASAVPLIMHTTVRMVGWVILFGGMGCGEATNPPHPGTGGRGSSGSSGSAGSNSGTGGAQAGEGGDDGEAGEAGETFAGRGGAGRGGTGGRGGGAGRGGTGGTGGGAGRGGNGGAGISGMGGTSGSSGASGTAGTAGTAGDPCGSDNGGCDPLTTCSSDGGARVCGACPDQYTGTGETGCVPKPCTGAPGVDCPCVKVAPTGDDIAAVESGGRSPFASIQAAIDFADSHRNVAVNVCVASAAECCPTGETCEDDVPTYSGSNETAIVMRNGISVFGRYESTTFTRCQAPARLVPSVDIGPEVQTPTTLDGFRLPSKGVVAREAREVTLSNLTLANEAGASTWCGIDASDGATLTISNVSVVSAATDPPIPGELVGIRAMDSRLALADSYVRLDSGGDAAVGVWLEDSPASTLDGVRVDLDVPAPTTETTLTGIRVIGSGEDVVVSGGTVTVRTGDINVLPVHQFGIDVTDADGLALAGITVNATFPFGQVAGVRALRSTIELEGTIRIRTQEATGSAVELSDSTGSQLTVNIDAADRRGDSGEFWGIRLSGNSANVEISGSDISVDAFGANGGGIFLDGGDGTGVEIRESTVLASRFDGELSGIRLEDCGGAAPSIVQNSSIVALLQSGSVPVEAIHAAGDCHPRIEGNAYIASVGEEGGGSTHTAIHCTAASRCAILDNLDVRAQSLSAGRPPTNVRIFGRGIHCSDGGCSTITGNQISGLVMDGSGCQRSCETHGYGIHLEATDVLVAQNVISGGCGGITRGILGTLGATGRAENNLIYGRKEFCGTASTGAMIWSSVGIEANGLNVHSNSIWAGGSTLSIIDCTSSALMGGGHARNNRLETGSCNIAYVASGSWTVFQNNALLGVSSALYAPDLDIDEVNAMPNSTGNISASCDDLLGSPCIDAGTADGAPSVDFYGNPRDIAPDIGAVEWIPPQP
jgi:hypothetical protein